MTITQTIRALLQAEHWIGTKPKFINAGSCGQFADGVEERMNGEAVPVWGDDLPRDAWSPHVRCIPDWFTHAAPFHCFVKHQNRYYDSECPEGVDRPDELPFYQREIEFHRKKGLRLQKVCVGD